MQDSSKVKYGVSSARIQLRPRWLFVACLLALLVITPALVAWEVYEETNVKGTIRGTIKKGAIIKMQSGSIYEVTDITLQLVLELAPEALVLNDGDQFKITIKGFEEPLICAQLVPPHGNKLSGISSRPTPPSASALPKDTRLETLMTPDQQQAIGIHKLTPEEKERLRQYLINFSAQTGERNNATNTIPVSQSTFAAPSAVYESRIDGEFNGWEGETIFKLQNGQIWQQSEYNYNYHYAFSPEVLVYRSGGGYKMKVNGVEKVIGVNRLR